MLNDKIRNAFNGQLNAELFSSYLYLSMAAHFQSQGLRGMARWMQIQAREELEHMMKFFDFIHERGSKVILTQIEAPRTEWSSPLEVFEDACRHEAKITGLINGLAELAVDEKDHAANAFLQWFITEQVEEEATVQEIRDKLKLVSDNPVALFMIDQELSHRNPPPGGTAQA